MSFRLENNGTLTNHDITLFTHFQTTPNINNTNNNKDSLIRIEIHVCG